MTKEEILQTVTCFENRELTEARAMQAMDEYARQMIKEDREMIRDAVLKHWGEHINIEDIDAIYLINPIGSQ